MEVSEVAPQEAVSEVAPQEVVSEVAPQEAVSEVAPQEVVSEVAPQEAVSEVAPQVDAPVDLDRTNSAVEDAAAEAAAGLGSNYHETCYVPVPTTTRVKALNKVAPAPSGGTNGEAGIKAATFSMKGGRDYQEDRCICILDFNAYLPEGVPNGTPRSLFAVFDGHGGPTCSSYLAHNFHINLAAHPKIVDDPRAALEATWKATDDGYEQDCRTRVSSEGKKVWRQGSTASVVMLVGTTAFLANSGAFT
jgi:hypothetical protein